jgi:hypothetical protein
MASDEVTIVFFEVYPDSIILDPRYYSRRSQLTDLSGNWSKEAEMIE